LKKKLSEMTNEELWELFPIFLVNHKDEWENNYKEEEKNLSIGLHSFLIRRIEHIGSTSIAKIWAKDIVDILLEIEKEESIENITEKIISLGYRKMSSTEKRVSFNKGYTESGFAEKVFHLHLRFAGDNDELYFRDYLKEYPQAAKEYEEMKLSLAKKYQNNRDAYTDAKTEFIKKITDLAKIKYINKYE